MSRLGKWFYRNFDLVQSIRVWAIISLIAVSAGMSGYLFAWGTASAAMAQQRADSLAEVQRLQDINRQLLLIIEQRLPAIAETAQEAARTAKDAAARAGTAGRTANTAASTASVAAGKANAAARAVEDAIAPARSAPAGAPEWLDTP